MLDSLKQLLKRSSFFVTTVNFARDLLGGQVRTNYEIVDRLGAFSPYSAGTLRARGELTLQSAQQTFPLLCDLLNAVSKSALEPVAIESLFPTRIEKTEADELAVLFRSYRSDKASFHNYHLLYGPLLADKRTEQLRILEIGLGTNNTDVVSHMGPSGTPGASLRAFRDFFPRALLYGADVDHRILFAEDRIKTYYVDQTNADSFRKLGENLANDSFDLIIDDGLHSPNANLATLIFALRILRPGGFFIVEDIAAESIPIWQVVSVLLPPGCNAKLIQAEKGLLFLITKPTSI
jgi:SAM-dependent methyltransferase